MNKRCITCDVKLSRKKGESFSYFEARKYCNRNCFKNKPKYGRGSKFNCINCGKEHIKCRSNQKYCGARCQMNYEYSKGSRNKFQITKKANQTIINAGIEKFKTNPKFMINDRGYKCIYVPQRGFIQYHRWIWEKEFGPIPKYKVIHHKDHNKNNNNIDNLELMSLSKHSKLHYMEREIDNLGRLI